MDDSENIPGNRWLRFLSVILSLAVITYVTLQFGIPYYNARCKKKEIATPVPTPELVETPTPTPHPNPCPTTLPIPEPSPEPTPKPTVWTPPPPDRVYPNEWINVVDGTKYENVQVLLVEPDRVTLKCDQGTVIIRISFLAPDVQTKLNFDPTLAGQVAAKRELDKIYGNP